jgi:hypothetical protein
MAELRFEPPAEPIPNTEICEEFAEKLKANMGEWALIGKCKTPGAANQRAYMFRHGQQKGFEPSGSFEAESRTLLGEHRVYVRYMGDPDE